MFLLSLLFSLSCVGVSSEDVVKIPNGISDGQHVWNEERALKKEFLLQDPSGRIFANSALDLSYKKQLEEKKQNFENVPCFQERVALLTNTGVHNWYHFLLQILPKLCFLKDAQEYDALAVGIPQECKNQRAAFNAAVLFLKIPQAKIRFLQENALFQADLLLVPSIPFHPAQGRELPKWEIDFLRAVFVENAPEDVKTFEFQKRFVISRAKASCRQINDEEKLMDFLGSKGFVSLCLEEFSVFEQACLFSSAETIVAPHGAGLANLVFCGPNVRVVEIDHRLKGPDQRSCFPKLAARLGLNYFSFYTELKTENDLETDLTINLKDFEEFFENLLSQKA